MEDAQFGVFLSKLTDITGKSDGMVVSVKALAFNGIFRGRHLLVIFYESRVLLMVHNQFSQSVKLLSKLQCSRLMTSDFFIRILRHCRLVAISILIDNRQWLKILFVSFPSSKEDWRTSQSSLACSSTSKIIDGQMGGTVRHDPAQARLGTKRLSCRAVPPSVPDLRPMHDTKPFRAVPCRPPGSCRPSAQARG